MRRAEDHKGFLIGLDDPLSTILVTGRRRKKEKKESSFVARSVHCL